MQDAHVLVVCPNCLNETKLKIECGQVTGFCQKCGEVIDLEIPQ